MALGAEEATFNAAVDTLIAAWEVVLDAMSANEEFQIVFMKRQLDADHSATTGNATRGLDGSLGAPDWDMGRRFIARNTPDVTDSFIVSIGERPLFFKITNAAGDLT